MQRWNEALKKKEERNERDIGDFDYTDFPPLLNQQATDPMDREDTHFLPSIHLFPFLVRNSTSDHAAGTKKLSECTNVGGMVARKHTVL